MKAKYLGESWGISLTKNKIYECLGYEGHFIRIIDDTGEAYLYCPPDFEIIDDDESEETNQLKKRNELDDDFSDVILEDLIKSCFEGEELLTEFKRLKKNMPKAVKKLKRDVLNEYKNGETLDYEEEFL